LIKLALAGLWLAIDWLWLAVDLLSEDRIKRFIFLDDGGCGVGLITLPDVEFYDMSLSSVRIIHVIPPKYIRYVDINVKRRGDGTKLTRGNL